MLDFNEHRDEAMFQAVLALEEGDQRARRQAAQAAAREGLALFGLAGDGPAHARPFRRGPVWPG